jgi:Hydantoinase/oxoprolinase/Protein of unknown function (DUF917)
LRFARHTIRNFKAAIRKFHLTCPLFVTQNDGTLIDAGSAAKLPIRTFSSGATNSMRGASYLGMSTSTSTSAIVVDIGGTTSDVGVLLPSGYPREASSYVTLAGIRINYRMPHVESIGIGGGSLVEIDDRNEVTVGPRSVGHELTSMAKVFGGNILTATDIAIAYSKTAGDIGDASLAQDIDQVTIAKARKKIKALLEKVIDIMKTSPDDLPVLLVGGGAHIAPDKLEGVSEVIRPPFYQVANAVGAAISMAGATVDFVQSTASQSISEAVEKARQMAIEKAVNSGVVKESIVVTEQDSIPLNFVPHTVRTIVRVVGDVSDEARKQVVHSTEENVEDDGDEEISINSLVHGLALADHKPIAEDVPIPLDISSYRPTIKRNPHSGNVEWILSETDATWISDGCYILGCAGGGNPRGALLKLKRAFKEGHGVRVIDASCLRPDARIYCKYTCLSFDKSKIG